MLTAEDRAVQCAQCTCTIATSFDAHCMYGPMRGGKKTDTCCVCAHGLGWSGFFRTGCSNCRARANQAENTAIGAGFSVPAIDPDNGMEEKSSKSFIEAVRERRAERLNGPFTSFDATSNNSQSDSFKSAYDMARQRKLAHSSWGAQPCGEPAGFQRVASYDDNRMHDAMDSEEGAGPDHSGQQLGGAGCDAVSNQVFFHRAHSSHF